MDMRHRTKEEVERMERAGRAAAEFYMLLARQFPSARDKEECLAMASRFGCWLPAPVSDNGRK